MTDSPFSRVGARLVDQGYSCIPILPMTKRPGTYSRGRWFGDLDWNRFCSRRPTDLELSIWEKWPDAGICVALGPASGNLVAIDVDCDRAEIIQAIEAALPEPSPVQKAGKKGYTSFYRASEAVKSCAFNLHGERVLDLLANGKQSLIPPTIHPDTARPYEWLTESTFEQISPDRLPKLPDDIAIRLGNALTDHGYYAPVERPPSDGSGPWREVNEVALGNFEAWLPALGIEAKRQHNGTWRGKAIWKGAENANVGFSSTGIKDWGEDRGMTALDVVMEAHGVDFPTADKWLREKLGFKDPPPVKFVFRKPEPEAEPVERPAAPIGTPEAKVDPFDHKVAGGLMQRTAEWIMSTSFVPSRELSLLAAIAAMSAFMARRYVGPTGLAPNLYLVGIASTGSGKDAPLRALKNLFLRGGGMDHMLGAGDLTSDSAIERLVRGKPASVCPMDEIGAWLQEGAARNAPGFAKARRKVLLELYTNACVGGVWLGKDRAGAETLSSSEPIYSPCLSILGMSTETLFFKGLTEENTTDGFLNRLTVVHIPPCTATQDVPTVAGVPVELKAAYEAAFEAWTPPDVLQKINYRSATADPYLLTVPYADEAAKAAYKAIWEWQESVIMDAPDKAGIAKRYGEQTLKLAMIRAVSRDFAAPAITVEDVNFGSAIVGASVDMLDAGMQRYMSGSEFEDNCKVMLRAVGDAPHGKGLAENALRCKKGVAKIKPRDFDEAARYLTTTGQWEARKSNRGTRYVPLGDRVAVEEVA